MLHEFYLKVLSVGQERWLKVKSTDCSGRGHGFGSSTHLVTPNLLKLQFGGSNALFWPPWYCLHVVHRYTCGQNTHTSKRKHIIKQKEALWEVKTVVKTVMDTCLLTKPPHA